MGKWNFFFLIFLFNTVISMVIGFGVGIISTNDLNLTSQFGNRVVFIAITIAFIVRLITQKNWKDFADYLQDKS